MRRSFEGGALSIERNRILFFERALIYFPLKLRAALFRVYTVLVAFDGFITFESFITFVASTEYNVCFSLKLML